MKRSAFASEKDRAARIAKESFVSDRPDGISLRSDS